jgi:hypothetical protein
MEASLSYFLSGNITFHLFNYLFIIFKDAVSNSNCIGIESTGMVINELERMWNEAVVV